MTNKKNLQIHHCKFDILKENIEGIYKEEGKKWISNLPEMVDQLRDHWNLVHIAPVDNMTYHFVAKAETESRQQVVVKIGIDKNVIENEKQSLAFFNGNGAIRLFDYYDKCNAILIDQAVPGRSLKSIYPEQFDVTVTAYAKTMQKLHDKALPVNHSFPHINDWLQAIDLVSKDKFPNNLIENAMHLKNQLLSTMPNVKLLHGDLHHDNILQYGNEWISIDPKGVVGEVEFEAAAFDFLTTSERSNNNNASEIINKRIEHLAKISNLNLKRLMDWVYVRLILMAVWMIEDNGDPTWTISLANRLYRERI